jgi:hypothetical protein
MDNLPHLRKRFRKGRHPFYEVICECEAYSYPHRFGGGYCDGMALLQFFWEKGMCGNCRFRDQDSWSNKLFCQIINGQEDIAECEQLQEFLRANEAHSHKFPKR